MRSFYKIVTVLDGVLVVFYLVRRDFLALLNSQVAFIASLLVVFGSFYGYKRMVEKRAKNFTGKDIIERMEDPYELYEEMEVAKKSAKEIIEEEKRRIKKSESVKHFIKSGSAFASPYRLFGYGFLVLSILVLVRRDLFSPFAYLIGLGIVPVGAMVFALWGRSDHSSM